MSTLNVSLIAAPDPIKRKLVELSESIDFTRACDKGANGYTFFGKNLVTNRRVAVKFYYWGKDPQYHAEPQHLTSIRSNHVVPLLDAAYVDHDYAYFVSPFYPNGDMDDLMSRGGVTGNKHCVRLVQNVLTGLVELHAARLLHRDLKPQNILIDHSGRALIGDFGSVKAIPDGADSVPGSGHSLIYRPPESVVSGQYGVRGDLYQVGILLYQLLGGSLPYDETDWLNKRQLKEYQTQPSDADRSIYVSRVVSDMIVRGNIIDVGTLPPWVCSQLRRTIKKACNADVASRFDSTAAFLAHLAKLAPSVHDWQVQEGCPTLLGRVSYRICMNPAKGTHTVEKRLGSGWRKDNTISGSTLGDVVQAIEAEVRR